MTTTAFTAWVGDEPVTVHERDAGEFEVRLASGAATSAVTRHDILEALDGLWQKHYPGAPAEVWAEAAYVTDTWALHEVATLVATACVGSSGGLEFTVDDVLFSCDAQSSAYSLLAEFDQALETASWSLDGGSGSPGNADHGEYCLFALGGRRYEVHVFSDGERSLEETFEADSDEQASRMFLQKYNGDDC